MATESQSLSNLLPIMRHLADVAALRTDPPGQRQRLIDGLKVHLNADAAFLYISDRWRITTPVHYAADGDGHTFRNHLATIGLTLPDWKGPQCLQNWCDDLRNGRNGHKLTVKRARQVTEARVHGDQGDGLLTFFPAGIDAERLVGVGVHRLGRSRLSRSQIGLTRLAVIEVRALIERGNVFLAPARFDPPLPQRLEQVLDHLLAGRPPKLIAQDLQLSIWTVREYIQRLYKHFNVSGREELMAKFVGGS